MQPDLASQNVSLFEFSGQLQLGRNRIRDVMRQGKAGPARVLIFQSSYKAAAKDHFASAVAYPTPRKPDSLLVDITYSLAPALHFKHEEARPVTELLELLAKERTETTFRCTLVLRYPSRAWNSPVKLPLHLIDLPSLPFDEIRGFRAVKFANGRKTRYSIIVDRPENRDFHHSVNFSFTARFDSSIIDVLLKEGVSVSRQFIRPRSPAISERSS